MKSMISMGELITEARDSRDCSSLLLVACKMKKKKPAYPNQKLEEIEKMCVTFLM